jgi:hypothetical protein
MNSLEKSTLILYLNELFNRIDYWFMITTVPLGIVLNFISVAIYTRPNLNKTTMGFFYINLSGWTIVTLIFFFFVQSSGILFGMDLTKLTGAGCATYMLVRRVTRQIPTWIEAFITFDRYIAISFPNKPIGKILKSKIYVTAIIFVMIFCLGLINIQNVEYYLVYTYKNVTLIDPVTNKTIFKNSTSVSCSSSKSVVLNTKIIAATIRALGPALFQLCFSILLVRKVLESKKNLNNKEDKGSTQFTRTVLTMNCVFFALNLPESILYFVNDSITSSVSSYDPLTVAIVNNIYLVSYDYANLYYSLKFFSYLFFNKLFFKEILILLRFVKENGNSTNAKLTKVTK